MKIRDPRLKKLRSFRRSDWWEGIYVGSWESEGKLFVAKRRTPVDDEIPFSFRKAQPVSARTRAKKKMKSIRDWTISPKTREAKASLFDLAASRREMFSKEHPNSWVRASASGEDWKLSPAAATADLRAHSRMY